MLKEEEQRGRVSSLEPHNNPRLREKHGNWLAEKGRKAGLLGRALLASRTLSGWKEEGSRAGQGRGGHCGAMGTTWRPKEEVGLYAQGAHLGEHPEVCFWYTGVKLHGLISLGEQWSGESVASKVSRPGLQSQLCLFPGWLGKWLPSESQHLYLQNGHINSIYSEESMKYWQSLGT